VEEQHLPGDTVHAQAFAESKFGPDAVLRLQIAFERSRHPMLIADDERRWVTGNAAASELLGISRKEVPWRRMDDFTPASQRARLEELWAAFLKDGTAEGWYQLSVPERGSVPVEFSATANVLPSRHLSIFISPDEGAEEPAAGLAWKPVPADSTGRLELTERERQVMTLVASGMQSTELAESLFLSPETVKSHVHNSMAKLGAHTRAHAVAIALVTGQISWEL
jgi:PAS domain S-box-containing protein